MAMEDETFSTPEVDVEVGVIALVVRGEVVTVMLTNRPVVAEMFPVVAWSPVVTAGAAVVAWIPVVTAGAAVVA